MDRIASRFFVYLWKVQLISGTQQVSNADGALLQLSYSDAKTGVNNVNTVLVQFQSAKSPQRVGKDGLLRRLSEYHIILVQPTYFY